MNRFRLLLVFAFLLAACEVSDNNTPPVACGGREGPVCGGGEICAVYGNIPQCVTPCTTSSECPLESCCSAADPNEAPYCVLVHDVQGRGFDQCRP